MYRFRLFVAFVAVAFLLSSCCRYPWEHDDNALKRTVLLYMVAENSLSSNGYNRFDLEELEEGAADIPSDCRMVVYVDDEGFPYLYALEKDKKGKVVHTVLKQYDTELDSSSKETLSDILSFVKAKYPSKSYGMIFWSHGSAWLPASRSIGIDNGKNTYSNTGTQMDISDLAEVLEAFGKLDFLLFDACFMQSIEVDWTLRNSAAYIIGSPAEIPGPGAPYNDIIAPMFDDKVDVQGIIDAYYHCYADSLYPTWYGSPYSFGVSLSAVKCDRLQQLFDVTEPLLEKYVSPDIDDDLIGVQRYNPVTSASRPEYYDLNGYMHHIIRSDEDYMAWKNAFDMAVPYRVTMDEWYSSYSYGMCSVDVDNYGGVSCFVPKNRAFYKQMMDWFRSTSWYSACWQPVGW